MEESDDDVLWSELGEFAPTVPPSPRPEPRVDLGPGGSLRQTARESRRRRVEAERTAWGRLRELVRRSRGEQWMRERARTERRCADVLAQLEPAGWHILHDRLLPGGEHRVSHIAVGPAGLAVITELPETGPLTIAGSITPDGVDDRQLYAGDLHLDTWLRTRRWEAAQLEQAVAAAHQDIVWSGPTVAIGVEVPPGDAAPPKAPPDLPYEWHGVLLRPVRTVPALLTGLPAPMPTTAVADLAALVAEICSPAGRPDPAQSNSDG